VSGLQRDDADSEAGKTYAMLIADTVVVKAGGGPPDLATALAPKDWKDVAYYLKVGSWAGKVGRRLLLGTECRCRLWHGMAGQSRGCGKPPAAVC